MQTVDDSVDCSRLLIDVPPPPKHIVLFHLIHFGTLVGKFPFVFDCQIYVHTLFLLYLSLTIIPFGLLLTSSH